MEVLHQKFIQRLKYVPMGFKRSIIYQIDWNTRLIGIKGARGIGKTTLLLQYIKENLGDDLDKTLFVSLDAIWFANNSLTSLVDHFCMRGGRYLFLDEVHKYPNWAQELKNAYDDHPTLKMVFTGSSALEILNARADLSRRAVMYNMQGFSFREYLSLETGIDLAVLPLKSILQNHFNLALGITEKLRPLQYFQEYLKNGYYPFYREGFGTYHQRLSEVINMILEIELPQLRGVEPGYVHKVKQLLSIIAESVPFIPNVTKLSEKIQLNRATLLAYLHYLNEIRLTNNIFRDASGISLLQKPSKVLLENTNLIFNLAPDQANKGNLRETFFSNQVGFSHSLQYGAAGDFMVDQQYVFEIGGKQKGGKQIEGVAHAYIVADDIETGLGNRIPLWLFGFLY